MVYATCKQCGRRFILRTKTNILGQTKAENYVIVSPPDEERIFVHKICLLRYRRDCIKQGRKFGISAGALGFSFGFNKG